MEIDFTVNMSRHLNFSSHRLAPEDAFGGGGDCGSRNGYAPNNL
jgi:hypothetical protein